MSLRLPQKLIRNSFNILGLPPTSTLKEIRKKAQELLQLAKIEEIQQFEDDIGHVCELRNESEVKLALERISGIKERLEEIFFWFDTHNVENQKAIALISQGNYEKAIEILEKASTSSVDWLCQKNLALALIFEAFATSNLTSFTRSLGLWKRIAQSEEFWKFYRMHYFLYDEFNTSSSLFQEFRGSICKYLSNFAVSFYQQTGNPKVIGECYSVFGRLETSIDIEIIQPIILKINKELKDLEVIIAELNIDVSLIKRRLEEILGQCSELDNFELLEYSPFIILKNDISQKLRKLYVEIYNQNHNIKIAQLFIDTAFNLVSSGELKKMIETDKELINEQKLWKIVSTGFETLKQLIGEEKIDQAKNLYLDLDNKLAIIDQASAKETRANLLLHFCSLLMERGCKIFEKKRVEVFNGETLSKDWDWKNQKAAIKLFDYVKELLKNHLSLFRFVSFLNIECDPLIEIENISSSLKDCEISKINEIHKSCLKSIERIACRQKHDKTYSFLNMIGEAQCFTLVFRRIHDHRLSPLMKKIILISSVIIFILFAIFGSDSKTSEKPATNRPKSVTYRSNPYPRYNTYQPAQLYEPVPKKKENDHER